MEMVRQVVVLDAAELEPESSFWAALLGGRVVRDAAWHSVLDAAGRWCLGVQLAPGHVAPSWPAPGVAQQVHLDLHVGDPHAAHTEVTALGARLLQPGDLCRPEGHQVYADPAGHPFCLGWGQPSDDQVAEFVARLDRDG